MQWKKHLLTAARHVDDGIDKITAGLRQRLGLNSPVHIVPFRTYGTPYKIFVRGRVLEDRNIAEAHEGHGLWDNLLNMYKRFESNEVVGAKVKISLHDEEHIVTTDKEGFFVFDLNPNEPVITEELYHTIDLYLIEAPVEIKTTTAKAEIMIPPADAEYGIISDIDDTIIRTKATSLLQMGKTVLLSNSKTRLPYAGVTEFYKALQLGRNGQRNNPFFYVSSSPWNLYDLVIDFMDHNEIPGGPLLLRDFGLQSDSFMSGDYLSHKYKEIKNILETYPHLNFVLVGDSGEQDPPIYFEVVKNFPDRIISIYIRDVEHPEKHQSTVDIANALKAFNVEMILTKDTVKAAEHAAASGLIYTEKIPEIIQDKKEDKGEVAGKQVPEKLLSDDATGDSEN